MIAFKLFSVYHGYVLQVREIRNQIFHSADFKLSDTELDDYIKDMTTLLQDPTQLLNDTNAKSAVTQLNKVTPSHCKFHTYIVSRCFAINCLIDNNNYNVLTGFIVKV